ncbi:MAG: AraC family transcriptional regulator [Pseudomonadota bacterium]
MQSFDEIATAPRFRHAIRERSKVGTLSLGVLQMQFSPQLIEGPPVDYAALAVINSATRIKHRYPGSERPMQDFTPGDMILRPPNLSYESQVFDPLDVSVFAIAPEVVKATTTAFNADVGEVFARLEARPFRSPLIASLCRQLSDCARTGCDRLYVDSLSFALIHELWRIADGHLHPSETSPGKLTPHQLRRIDEFVADAPRGQVDLGRLACALKMSTTAFTAAIKATTGQTPYQYVLSRRLDRARDLAETTTLSLAEIAFRCGFSSQSHMTDVFRAKLGTTPGQLRRAR